LSARHVINERRFDALQIARRFIYWSMCFLPSKTFDFTDNKCKQQALENENVEKDNLPEVVFAVNKPN